ncbi:uncharacterized protein EMH_0018840 [Eimeria mitis]|uniref:Myosin heavy chain n=1 Tax=Eimeria mitis TaxID=44415 RepID=U6KM20_9EIME|nr:uncharacterized protein EMH_0018840 [Eimeria mitis]CDJ36503.1 hypothetical protein, conserved [Eimeria mitis]
MCFVAALATAYLLLRCFFSLAAPASPAAYRALSAAEGDDGIDGCMGAQQQQQGQQQQQPEQQQEDQQDQEEEGEQRQDQKQLQQDQERQQRLLQEQQRQQYLMQQVRQQIGLLTVTEEAKKLLTEEEDKAVQDALCVAQELLKQAKDKVAAVTEFKKSLEEDNAELQRQLEMLPPGTPHPPKSDLSSLQQYRKEASEAVEKLYAVGCSSSQHAWTLLQLAERRALQQEAREEPIPLAPVAAVVAANTVLGFPAPPLVVRSGKAQEQLDKMVETMQREIATWLRVLKQPTLLKGTPHVVQKQLTAAASAVLKARHMAAGLQELQMQEKAQQLRTELGQVEMQLRSVERRQQEQEKEEQEKQQRRRRQMQEQDAVLATLGDSEKVTARLKTAVDRVAVLLDAGPLRSDKQVEEAEDLYEEIGAALGEAGSLNRDLLKGTRTGELLDEAAGLGRSQIGALQKVLHKTWERSLLQHAMDVTLALRDLTAAHEEIERDLKKPETAAAAARAAAAAAAKAAAGETVRALTIKEEGLLHWLEKVLIVHQTMTVKHQHMERLLHAYNPEQRLLDKLKQLGDALEAAQAGVELATQAMLRWWLLPLDEAAENESKAREALKELQNQLKAKKEAGEELSEEEEEKQRALQKALEDAKTKKLSAAMKVAAGDIAFRKMGMPQPVQDMLQFALPVARAPLAAGSVFAPDFRPVAEHVNLKVTLPRLKFLFISSTSPPSEVPVAQRARPPAGADDGGAAASTRGLSTLQRRVKAVVDEDEKDPLGSVSSLLSTLGNPPIDEGASLMEFAYTTDPFEEVQMPEGAAAPPSADAATAVGADRGGKPSKGKSSKRREGSFRVSLSRKPSKKSDPAASAVAEAGGKGADESEEPKAGKGSRRPRHRRWKTQAGVEWDPKEEPRGGGGTLPRHWSLRGTSDRQAVEEALLKSRSLDSRLTQTLPASPGKQKRRSLLGKAFSMFTLRRSTGSISQSLQEAADAAEEVERIGVSTLPTTARGTAAETSLQTSTGDVTGAGEAAAGLSDTGVLPQRWTEEGESLQPVGHSEAKSSGKKGKESKKMPKRGKSEGGDKST